MQCAGLALLPILTQAGLVAVAEVGHESFVPAHPLDPLQATIHAVNVVGWYPEVGLCTLESS